MTQAEAVEYARRLHYGRIDQQEEERRKAMVMAASQSRLISTTPPSNTTQAQKSVPPYYTNDPNDPRIKAYKDSLYAFQDYGHLYDEFASGQHKDATATNKGGVISGEAVNLSRDVTNISKNVLPNLYGNTYPTERYYFNKANLDLGLTGNDKLVADVPIINEPKQKVILKEKSASVSKTSPPPPPPEPVKESGVGTPVSKTRTPIGSISVMGKAIPYYSEKHKKELVQKFEPYGLKDWKGDGNWSHSSRGHKFKGWSEGKLYDKKGNIIYEL